MANGGIIGPVIEPTLSSTNGGDKITAFTSSGTFTVSNNNGPKAVHYLVVGGGGDAYQGEGVDNVPAPEVPTLMGSGGGGAGGFRTSFPGGTALTIPGSTPVTVGGPRSASVFGPITSAGGGHAGTNTTSSGGSTGSAGGSGGGGAKYFHGGNPGGAGDTPPTTPPQGNSGGNVSAGGLSSPGTKAASAGGGGAGGAAGPLQPVPDYTRFGGSGIVVARETDCVYVSSGVWSMDDVLDYRKQSKWAE